MPSFCVEDDAPLVIKDVEVKRMQRMEALKMHRPYISTADDGSGWVSVNTTTEQGTYGAFLSLLSLLGDMHISEGRQ